MREISEAQACAIALRSLGYSQEEKDRVQAVYDAGTEDPRFLRGQVELDHGSSDCCWMVILLLLRRGAIRRMVLSMLSGWMPERAIC